MRAIEIPADAVLLIIDVQQGFDDPYWRQRNNLQAEENIGKLLDAWRQSGRPVLHVQHLSQSQHSPLRPDAPGSQFKDVVLPREGEPVVQKRVNSAFIGTDLEAYLRAQGYEELVIVGLTTDHCVSTTTRMAANLGFQAVIVSDATATFGRESYDGKMYPAEEIHKLALVSLHNEFATVVDTATVLKATGSKQ